MSLEQKGIQRAMHQLGTIVKKGHLGLKKAVHSSSNDLFTKNILEKSHIFMSLGQKGIQRAMHPLGIIVKKDI